MWIAERDKPELAVISELLETKMQTHPMINLRIVTQWQVWQVPIKNNTTQTSLHLI